MRNRSGGSGAQQSQAVPTKNGIHVALYNLTQYSNSGVTHSSHKEKDHGKNDQAASCITKRSWNLSQVFIKQLSAATSLMDAKDLKGCSV